MSEFPRRSLLTGAAVAVASTVFADSAAAQYVWQKSDWQSSEFDALVRSPRRIKQIIHTHEINGARFLGNTKNSLNGLRLGAGIPADQIQILCVLNGPANTLNYSDYIWKKYRLGEWTKVVDPQTNEPAVRNIYYPSTAGASLKYSSEDASSPDSANQDSTIQGLQARGVRFVSCHTSNEEAARQLIKLHNLSVQPEVIAQDMQSHALPGVVIVPSVAAALALLQCEGHYSYMAP